MNNSSFNPFDFSESEEITFPTTLDIGPMNHLIKINVPEMIVTKLNYAQSRNVNISIGINKMEIKPLLRAYHPRLFKNLVLDSFPVVAKFNEAKDFYCYPWITGNINNSYTCSQGPIAARLIPVNVSDNYVYLSSDTVGQLLSFHPSIDITNLGNFETFSLSLEYINSENKFCAFQSEDGFIASIMFVITTF